MRKLWPFAAMVVATCAAWAFAELVVWNRLPAGLVGKWIVEGGEQDGANFEFFPGGRMRGRINVGGNESLVDAQVVVEHGRLLSTTTNPHTGRSDVRVHTIVQLTETRLTLRDERGTTLRMVRVDE